MDGFEINKILMAVILALLISMVASKVSDIFVSPHELTQVAYVIEGVETSAKPTSQSEEKIDPIEPFLVKADTIKGAEIAKKCLQCHSLGKGEKPKIAPNLYGIVNAKFAHEPDYSYSKELQEKQGNWTYENLNHFLYKPRSFIKGTKMTFAGLSKETDRANIIMYLRTLSDSPQPLPNSDTK